MKKIILIIFLALLVYSIVFWVFLDDKIFSSGNDVLVPQEQEIVGEVLVEEETKNLCFEYEQEASEEAPYSVKENIKINIDGNLVSGTKKGNQEGPDMTNGYEGTLSGEINGDSINVIFNYIVEGSNQKEQEEYILKDENLIKQRYVLVEKDDVLVPDKEKFVSEISYQSISCN